MPQSLAKLHMHLIFSTKDRRPLIDDAIRTELHRYLGGVLKGLRCMPVLMNSVEDHIHILFDLARTISPAEAVQEIKTSSSKWINAQHQRYQTFGWQNGYGMFAVSQSAIPDVCKYIGNQHEHHRSVSFKEEYIIFLKKHELDYDERYVWD